MSRSLIILICLSLSFCCYAQKIEGTYFGYFPTNRLHVPNTSTTIFNPVYDSAKLILKSNGKFKLAFKNTVSCPTYLNSRFCSGSYNVSGDTLQLTSKHTSDEFYHIDYNSSIPQKEDSTLIVIKADDWAKAGCLLKGHRIYVDTDLSYNTNMNLSDSVWISSQTKRIKVSMGCPTDMDWLVNLKNEIEGNRIEINLFCGVGNENLATDNLKLLVKQDTLMMLDEFYYLKLKNDSFYKVNR